MSKQAQDVATSDEPSLEEVLAVSPPTEASKANKYVWPVNVEPGVSVSCPTNCCSSLLAPVRPNE
jgi:hypothetical protein